MRDLGTFTRYTPDEPPEWAGNFPLGLIVFARNEDGDDWYDVVRTLEAGKTLVLTWPDDAISAITDEYEQWPVPTGQRARLYDRDDPALVALRERSETA